MSFVAVAVGVVVAGAAIGGSVAANGDRQKGLKSAAEVLQNYGQRSRDTLYDATAGANAQLDPYTGPGQNVLSRWNMQDGNFSIPRRPAKTQFTKSDGSVDVQAWRNADSEWVSRVTPYMQALGLGAPPSLPNNRGLSQKDREAANKAFRLQQSQWETQYGGMQATPTKPQRKDGETAAAYAQRIKAWTKNDLIPWAQRNNVDQATIGQLQASVEKISTKKAKGQDRATFQANVDQLSSGLDQLLGRFGESVSASQQAIGDRNAQALEQIQQQQDPYSAENYKQSQFYSPQVYDEQTWKASGDPSYLGPANTLQDLQQTPGYAFGMQQGQEAVQQSAAARGGLYSGATMQDLQKFGSDYAAQKWENYFKLRSAAFGDAFNRNQLGFGNFARLAGGQQARQDQIDQYKVNLAANADARQSGNIYQTGVNTANQLGQEGAALANIDVQRGEANAAQSQGIAQGIASGVTAGVGAYGTFNGGVSPSAGQVSTTSPSFEQWRGQSSTGPGTWNPNFASNRGGY